jgi:hypothetical protein
MWYSQFRFTALIRAAQAGHADCVRLLLDVGADKDAKEYVRAARIIVCVHLVLFLTRVCANVQVPMQPPVLKLHHTLYCILFV